MKYIKPKIGDKVICIDDDSQDEQLGLSTIILKGTVGLKEGKEYEIKGINLKHVPDRMHKHGYAIWTKDEYPMVKWAWTYALIEGHGFSQWMFLKCFKRT